MAASRALPIALFLTLVSSPARCAEASFPTFFPTSETMGDGEVFFGYFCDAGGAGEWMCSSNDRDDVPPCAADSSSSRLGVSYGSGLRGATNFSDGRDVLTGVVPRYDLVFSGPETYDAVRDPPEWECCSYYDLEAKAVTPGPAARRDVSPTFLVVSRPFHVETSLPPSGSGASLRGTLTTVVDFEAKGGAEGVENRTSCVAGEVDEEDRCHSGWTYMMTRAFNEPYFFPNRRCGSVVYLARVTIPATWTGTWEREVDFEGTKDVYIRAHSRTSPTAPEGWWNGSVRFLENLTFADDEEVARWRGRERNLTRWYIGVQDVSGSDHLLVRGLRIRREWRDEEDRSTSEGPITTASGGISFTEAFPPPPPRSPPSPPSVPPPSLPPFDVVFGVVVSFLCSTRASQDIGRTYLRDIALAVSALCLRGEEEVLVSIEEAEEDLEASSGSEAPERLFRFRIVVRAANESDAVRASSLLAPAFSDIAGPASAFPALFGNASSATSPFLVSAPELRIVRPPAPPPLSGDRRRRSLFAPVAIPLVSVAGTAAAYVAWKLRRSRGGRTAARSA